MRVSPSAVFVVFAVLGAGAVGIAARSATGRSDASAALPSDAERFGFAVRQHANDVALLDATRPFEIGLGNGPVRGAPSTSTRLTAGRALVTRELLRYSPAFLRAAHLRGIVFVEDLREGDNAIPSLPNVGGLMLLDLAGSEADVVRALHHEVFHFADLADDGQLAHDTAWEALNRPGFSYGAGGRTLRAGWAAAPATDLDGFVSAYATSGAEEDKAETFAFLMTRRDAVRARLDSDGVLRAKVTELARRLATLDAQAPERLGLGGLVSGAR